MKKSFLISAFFLTFQLCSHAQATGDAWQYAKTITEPGLRNVLSIIASEQMQGRETGTEGQRRAAIFIENQFKAIGLTAPAGLAGYQQKYVLYRDSTIYENIRIGDRTLNRAEDYVLPPGFGISANINNAGIVFAGYGIDDQKYSDYQGKNVNGKVVVVLSGEPKRDGNYLVSGSDQPSPWSGSDMTKKVTAAADHGAAALIFINPQQHQLPQYLINRSQGNRLYFPSADNGKKNIPVIYTVPDILEPVFQPLNTQILTDLHNRKEPLNGLHIAAKENILISFSKKRFSVLASNVIGYIEGSDRKNEYLLITGHYDHLGIHDGEIYHGADDDGSGTTGVIAMAEAFMKAKKAGHGPRRTIVFMTVSGEEEGLWGSAYYSEHPVFPLDKTTADLNTDMIGRIDPARINGDSTNYVYVIGNDKISSDLDPIVHEINKKYMNLELDFKFNDPNDPERIFYRSDHYNFARKGVPIIFYFDGIHKDYHRPTDTVDKINFDLMEKRIRYTFLTAWEMANRNDMLKRDIPLPDAGR